MPPPPLVLGRGIRGGRMMRDVRFSEDYDDPLLPSRSLSLLFVWRVKVFSRRKNQNFCRSSCISNSS